MYTLYIHSCMHNRLPLSLSCTALYMYVYTHVHVQVYYNIHYTIVIHHIHNTLCTIASCSVPYHVANITHIGCVACWLSESKYLIGFRFTSCLVFCFALGTNPSLSTMFIGRRVLCKHLSSPPGSRNRGVRTSLWLLIGTGRLL